MRVSVGKKNARKEGRTVTAGLQLTPCELWRRMGRGGTANLILNLGSRWRLSGKLHTPAALAALPIPLQAGWTPEPIRMAWGEKLFFPLEDWATIISRARIYRHINKSTLSVPMSLIHSYIRSNPFNDIQSQQAWCPNLTKLCPLVSRQTAYLEEKCNLLWPTHLFSDLISTYSRSTN